MRPTNGYAKWEKIKMSIPFLLYHWSPASRRKSILKYGLVPGKKSVCGTWNPPYVCFSKSPSYSYGSCAFYKTDVKEWDLWMVWSNSLEVYEILPPLKGCDTKEYRVYHRIKKSRIWYVGSRLTGMKGEKK